MSVTGDTVGDTTERGKLATTSGVDLQLSAESASALQEPALGSAPMEPTTDTLETPTEPAAETAEPLVEDDLLVEEISIDGMCGVY